MWIAATSQLLPIQSNAHPWPKPTWLRRKNQKVFDMYCPRLHTHPPLYTLLDRHHSGRGAPQSSAMNGATMTSFRQHPSLLARRELQRQRAQMAGPPRWDAQAWRDVVGPPPLLRSGWFPRPRDLAMSLCTSHRLRCIPWPPARMEPSITHSPNSSPLHLPPQVVPH